MLTVAKLFKSESASGFSLKEGLSLYQKRCQLYILPQRFSKLGQPVGLKKALYFIFFVIYKLVLNVFRIMNNCQS